MEQTKTHNMNHEQGIILSLRVKQLVQKPGVIKSKIFLWMNVTGHSIKKA